MNTMAAAGGAKLAAAHGSARRARTGREAPSAPGRGRMQAELEEANAGKNGRPFSYSEGMIAAICRIRSMTGMSFRRMEGIAAALFGEDGAPDFTTLCRRFNKLGAALEAAGAVVVGDGGRTLVYTPDASSLGLSRTSGWCSYTHKSGPSFLTVEALTGGNDREIRAIRITEEGEGERTPAFKALMDEALGRDGADPGRRGREASGEEGGSGSGSGGFAVLCRHDGGESGPAAAARLAGMVDSMILACRSGGGSPEQGAADPRPTPPPAARSARTPG